MQGKQYQLRHQQRQRKDTKLRHNEGGGRPVCTYEGPRHVRRCKRLKQGQSWKKHLPPRGAHIQGLPCPVLEWHAYVRADITAHRCQRCHSYRAKNRPREGRSTAVNVVPTPTTKTQPQTRAHHHDAWSTKSRHIALTTVPGTLNFVLYGTPLRTPPHTKRTRSF